MVQPVTPEIVEWLNGLKAGDAVVVWEEGGPKCLTTVESVTKSEVRTTQTRLGYRYSRVTGRVTRSFGVVEFIRPIEPGVTDLIAAATKAEADKRIAAAMSSIASKTGDVVDVFVALGQRMDRLREDFERLAALIEKGKADA